MSAFDVFPDGIASEPLDSWRDRRPMPQQRPVVASDVEHAVAGLDVLCQRTHDGAEMGHHRLVDRGSIAVAIAVHQILPRIVSELHEATAFASHQSHRHPRDGLSRAREDTRQGESAKVVNEPEVRVACAAIAALNAGSVRYCPLQFKKHA